ncbi:MAG: DUF169 domain-containing protein [Candidatus Riflebacteria bacterium]|nr:DUF169 domain-containing protein [Candidatus Riflebacteria bacterium]
MAITNESLNRFLRAFRLETPIIALYECPPSEEFGTLVESKGRACCFAYYPRWEKGETLVIQRSEDPFANPTHGCPGLHRSLGIGGPYPPWMPNFLTDGKNGAPMGEGLKANPEIAAAFLERTKQAPKPSGDYLLMGPLRLNQMNKALSVTCFADPDRLSGLMTLATYWSSDTNETAAPFSSGCGLLWRDLALLERDRPVIGCTDIAMRRYVPANILSLTVTLARFEQMLNFPDDCFLNHSWWNELLNSRKIPEI